MCGAFKRADRKLGVMIYTIIPRLGRWRKEDHKFKATLSYTGKKKAKMKQKG